MFPDFFKRDLKPFGIALWMGLHVLGDIVEAHVFEGGDFLGVDGGNVVALAEPYVVELMFGEAKADGCLIDKGEDLVHGAGEAHFLFQPARRGGFERLTVAGMTATSVGPETGGVVFGQCPLLQQQLTFQVKNEYRKGAVKPWHDVGGHLLHDANLGILFVDKDYMFYHTLNRILRMSPS